MRSETTRVAAALAGCPPAAARRAVVVLGVHRSGTSLLAEVLGELGVRLGTGLKGADEWNAAGYFEREEIYHEQEALLERLDHRWQTGAGLAGLEHGWLRSAAVEAARSRLAALAAGEAQAGGLWGFKDPRTAVLLPLWQEIFHDLAIEPVYVLALRHPRAVAGSLARRDGLCEAHGELLWLETYLDALRYTRGALAAVVEYDRWFTDLEGQLGVLSQVLGLGGADLERRLERARGCVRSALRHHRAAAGEPARPPAERLYEALRLTATGSAPLPDRTALHEIEAQARELRASWAAGFWGRSFHPLQCFDRADLVAGESAQADLWTVSIGAIRARCLMLQPPARMTLRVPGGQSGRLRFAVATHPEIWTHPESGGCLFTVEVDQRLRLQLVIDPRGLPADRRWHEIDLPVPASASGEHTIALETAGVDGAHAFRWALWREPVFTIVD